MRFEFEAIPATFVARPNRFVVVVRLDRTGEVVRAHCADPGRMRELLTPDVRVFLSRSANPGRKTAFDLRFVEAPGTGQLVSIDSRLPNELFAEALCTGSLGAFAGFEVERREAAMPGHVVDAAGVRSRLDFVLRNGDGDRIWVEVKSATLVVDGIAYFPDARTERGRRHVLDLARLREVSGERTAIVFVVQRPDAHELRPQWDIDPEFAAALQHAEMGGVELYAYACSLTLKEMRIERRIEVVVSPGDQ